MVAHESGLSHLASALSQRARRIVSEDSAHAIAPVPASVHPFPESKNLGVRLVATARGLDRLYARSFLLIVRARHIVTVPPGWDGTRSAGYSDVPAYSRVLQLPRSTDSYGRRLPGLSFSASGQALTPPRNLPAPGRRQPLYVVFRLSRDLCFW